MVARERRLSIRKFMKLLQQCPVVPTVVCVQRIDRVITTLTTTVVMQASNTSCLAAEGILQLDVAPS